MVETPLIVLSRAGRPLDRMPTDGAGRRLVRETGWGSEDPAVVRLAGLGIALVEEECLSPAPDVDPFAMEGRSPTGTIRRGPTCNEVVLPPARVLEVGRDVGFFSDSSDTSTRRGPSPENEAALEVARDRLLLGASTVATRGREGRLVTVCVEVVERQLGTGGTSANPLALERAGDFVRDAKLFLGTSLPGLAVVLGAIGF